jgi:integrating conjugative element membrane protein (TIGR03747 family)
MAGDGANIEIGVTKAITAPFKVLSFGLLALFVVLVVRLAIDMWVLADSKPGDFLEPPRVTLARELARASAAPDFLGSTRLRAESWAALVAEWAYKKPGLLKHLEDDPYNLQEIDKALGRGLSSMDFAISRAMSGSQIIAIRAAILVSFLPWVGFLYGLAITDGAVERSRRKYGGGRESSTLYHRAKYFQVTIATVTVAGYLWWPETIEPAYIIVPGTSICAYLMRLQAKYYKKYI